MRTTLFLSAYLLVAGFLLGCDFNSTDVSNVDETFIEYLQRFVDEAEVRQAQIDLDGLDMNFVNEIVGQDTTFCAESTPAQGNNSPQIRISLERRCWARKSDPNREALIFHELGHAYLGRDHSTEQLPNGNWKSLMNPGALEDLYSTSSALLVFRVLEERRTYYLDELFDSTTAVPDWARLDTEEGLR